MAVYTMTLKTIIEAGINIFDFDYPIFDENFRTTFQDLFIKHFYFDEIGQETVGRFIQRLNTKLNLIMPYWNKIYESQSLEQRILDNYDVTETYERLTSGNTTGSSQSTNRNLYKDAPKTKVDISDVDIVNSITKDIADANSQANTQGTENWTRKMTGNIGVQTDADAIIKYESSLRNTTEEIFRELEELFMGVY